MFCGFTGIQKKVCAAFSFSQPTIKPTIFTFLYSFWSMTRGIYLGKQRKKPIQPNKMFLQVFKFSFTVSVCCWQWETCHLSTCSSTFVMIATEESVLIIPAILLKLQQYLLSSFQVFLFFFFSEIDFENKCPLIPWFF